MQFISERTIDEVAEELGNSEAAFERTIREMEITQPALLAYLFSDNFSLFSKREREFLLFLIIVIYEAVKRGSGPPPPLDAERLSQTEEHNWALIQGVRGRKFHDRLDVFFQHHPQEDLLAFVEDALSDDEDGYVTREGREAIFVAVKSVIDSWREQAEG